MKLFIQLAQYFHGDINSIGIEITKEASTKTSSRLFHLVGKNATVLCQLNELDATISIVGNALDQAVLFQLIDNPDNRCSSIPTRSASTP